MSQYKRDEGRWQQIPHVPLGIWPTPLQEAARLSETIAGPSIWIKRDDLTGFGFGGNKIRGLEFLLADALIQQADTLVTGAGPQSNAVRATAATAAHAGMSMAAVYSGKQPDRIEGNYRLTRLLGAEVYFTDDPDRASVDRYVEIIAAGLRERGRRPYVIPRGCASLIGVLGYVLAVYELAEQCSSRGITPDAIVLATGACGTQAGLLAGVHLLHLPWRVEGFTVSRSVAEVQARVYNLAQAALEELDEAQTITTGEVIVHDGFIGPGYGIATPDGAEAIRMTARCEGIFLDPTYSGKAMAGLLAYVRDGRYSPDETILFLHTGGEPALFVGEGSWLYE
jgi:D-cysteine desulfhydrase family pyridoxal phosphate-dependent enzyme